MKIALGTVQFGLPYGIANAQGQVSLDEATAILGYARQSGVDTLDTAIAYGNSEERLGKIGVQRWQVVSKLPALPENCADVHKWVLDSVRDSLRKLGRPSIYGLLLHRSQSLFGEDGGRLYAAMHQMKHDGLVGKIGVSIYDPSELEALCGRYAIDLVQAPFNLMDRRLINSGWLQRLWEQGTELHVRSVFLQGLLLMPANERPAKFGRWNSLWAKYDAWLKEEGISPLQACLRYALSISEIGKVVVGVDSLAQIEEILHAATSSPVDVPADIQTSDIDLLNPARWAYL